MASAFGACLGVAERACSPSAALAHHENRRVLAVLQQEAADPVLPQAAELAPFASIGDAGQAALQQPPELGVGRHPVDARGGIDLSPAVDAREAQLQRNVGGEDEQIAPVEALAEALEAAHPGRVRQQ